MGTNDCGLHMLQNLEALYAVRRRVPWEDVRSVPDLLALVPSARALDMTGNRELLRRLMQALRNAPRGPPHPTQHGGGPPWNEDPQEWREALRYGQGMLTR